MSIEKDSVVYFHYTLSGEDGKAFETSTNGHPMTFLFGHGNILPALEAEFAGKNEGDQFQVTLTPEQAYGERNEAGVQRIPIKHLATKGKLQKGQAVKVNTDKGMRDVTIVKVGKFNVDVDTNHPLAGLTITFDVSVEQVRPAEAEELAHGHVHGVGGHHH
ncbi:MAG: FKBP-type peptidyl-prolyl cis-trans isomerase SlyD [Bermanella sp.]|jgi:FKBP-type peptidyl-prolyl cis-trans isomerase SlyD